MKVQLISNQHNSPAFGEIFKTQGEEYSEKQQKVADQINDAMRKPLPEFGNRTAEDFYKSEYGMDFCLSRHDNPSDSIFMEVYKGVKEIGTGVNKAITYSDSFSIGIYDETHPFEVKDIETSKKDSNYSMFILPALVVIIGFLGIIGLAIANKHSAKPDKSVKPLIENTDSVKNKLDTIF